MGISKNFNATVECRCRFEASVLSFAEWGLGRIEY